MPGKSEETSSKILWIIIGGIVSLIVGVTTAFLINKLTASRPKLHYSTTSIEFFKGKTNQVGVVAIEIHNPGGKEIEELQCNVSFPNAIITESSCDGLPTDSFQLASQDNASKFTVPFFNPDESISLQFLIAPESDLIEPPVIDLRGKGIVGELAAGTDASNRSFFPALLTGIFSSYLAGLSLFSLQLGRNRRLRGRSTYLFFRQRYSSGEQKDEFAFLLGVHGFTDHAKLVRGSSRHFSWWTLADELAETVLSAQPANADEPKRAITVLQDLLEFYVMASSSEAKIHTSIARLAMFCQDTSLVESSIKKARDTNECVADFRCSVLPSLNAVQASETENGSRVRASHCRFNSLRSR